MRVKVTLYLDGKVWDETVQARDYQDAKDICKRRNSSRVVVVSATAVFG
jgi:hypothetical protein|tara:strand:- start:151 stop:297 length:147 start_codon:yes stop_codon:yes gene_type:complete